MSNIIDDFDLPELDFDIPSLDIHIPELELELLMKLELPIVELPDMELPTLDFQIEPLEFD